MFRGDCINAAFYEKETEVRQLLESKANVEARDRFGYRALDWAAYKGHLSIVKLLLAAKANVNAVDKLGDGTPLTKACYSSAPLNTSVVKYLLENGADLFLKNIKDELMLDKCKEHASKETTEILQQYQTELNQIKVAYPHLICSSSNLM